MNASNRINCVLILVAFLGGIQGANAFENVVCVTTPAEFQTALTNAETASLATVIEVTAGAYSIGTTLTYSSTNTSPALTIAGGYSGSLVHGLCSAQTPDPSLTVLDGGGLSTIMNLIARGNSITIEYLTFQNGHAAGISTGTLNVFNNSGETGAINISNNIFTHNETTGGSTFVAYFVNYGGDLSVLNNTVVNNSLSSGGGLAVHAEKSGSTLAINNNTVSGNLCLASGSGLVSAASFTQYSTTMNIANNIFNGNSGCLYDLFLNGGSASDEFNLKNNDIGMVSYPTTGGYTASGNMALPPGFVSNGDYRLAPSSPLVNSGINSPVGGVGTIDVAGNPRVVFNEVDIGAYELQDDIFKNGFE